jgi:FMNH2-dependent dimethyl sulfone monooxygenase
MCRRLTQRSRRPAGTSTLIAELNLNDIKGVEEPALDAWSTAAALAAVTRSIELMVAVGPISPPGLVRQAGREHRQYLGRRLALNVVLLLVGDEAQQYGLQFDEHDDRYARTREWLTVVDGSGTEKQFSFEGGRYHLQDAICEPKPAAQPRPDHLCRRRERGGQDDDRDAMRRLRDARRSRRGDRAQDRRHEGAPRQGGGRSAMQFGMAAFAIVRDSEAEAQRELERITALPPQPPKGFDNFDQWLSGTQLERELKLQEYSVSNRGLRPNLVGTPSNCRSGSPPTRKPGWTCCCFR